MPGMSFGSRWHGSWFRLGFMLNNVAGWRFPERSALVPAPALRKVEAIVRPSRLSAVRAALDRRGIEGFTVSDVKGIGHDKGRTHVHRGTAYAVDFIGRVKVEVVVRDAEAMPIARAVAAAARTGRVGDGLVLVHPIVEAVRIRTGERGLRAVERDPRVNEPDALPLAM